MSLINQVLKDLDTRGGTVVNTAFSVPRGIVLNARGPARIHHAWTAVTLTAAFGVFAASLYLALQPKDAPVEQQAPVSVLAPEPPPAPVVEVVQRDARVAPPKPEDDSVAASFEVQDGPASSNATIAPPSGDVPSALPGGAEAVTSRPVKTITPEQKADRLFAKAERALAAQQHQQGEVLFRQALFEYPGHMNARIRLAALMVEKGSDAAAERLLAQGLAVGYALELAKPYAQLLAARGAPDEALLALDRAAGPGESDAEWYALRAAVLYRLGRHAESVNAYQAALQARPGEALWWAGLAIAHEHNRQPHEALRAYERAGALEPGSAVSDYVNQRIRTLQTTDGY